MVVIRAAEKLQIKTLQTCTLSGLKGVKSLHFHSKINVHSVSMSIFPFNQVPEQLLKQTLTFTHNLILSGGGDLLQDQHQLHRPSRPHSPADCYWEREPGNHWTLAELQRLRRRCPAARDPQGGGGSCGAPAESQEAKWRHAGEEGTDGKEFHIKSALSMRSEHVTAQTASWWQEWGDTRREARIVDICFLSKRIGEGFVAIKSNQIKISCFEGIITSFYPSYIVPMH